MGAVRHRRSWTIRSVPEWLLGLALALVIVPLGAVVIAVAGAGDDPALDAAALADTEGLVVVGWDGAPVGLDEFRGRPLVIHLWTSSCGQCDEDMVRVQMASEILGAEVTFLGVDSQETDRAAAETMAGASGVTYPLAADDGGAIAARLGVDELPSTLILDGAGNLVDVRPGPISTADLVVTVRKVLEG